MPDALKHKSTKPATKKDKEAKKRELSAQHNFYSIKYKEGVLQRIIIKKGKVIDRILELHFYRYDIDTESFRYVRILDNQVEEVNEEIITDAFFRFVTGLEVLNYETESGEQKNTIKITSEMLRLELMEKIAEYFAKRLFNRLTPNFKIKIKSDTRSSKFLYFRNGFVLISKDGYKLLPYKSLDQNIWKNKILDRDFKENRGKGDFELFFQRICGHKTEGPLSDDTLRRILALKTITGYLLHGYFNYKLKALILTDSRISDDDEPNGRTGKTLYAKALGKILNYDDKSRVFIEINGKNFKHDDKHRYSDCSLETQLININDVRRNTFIDTWFNDITEVISVDKKNEKPFPIHAKIVLSTNRTIRIDGESALDRIIQFEFSDYYDSNRSPEMETGRWFFSQDWDTVQWNKFDSFLISCCVDYFKYGVIEADTINLKRRTLIDHTSHEFVDFMDDFFKTGITTLPDETDGQKILFELKFNYEEKINRKDLYLSFLYTYQHDYTIKNMPMRKFTRFLKSYAKYSPDLVELSERNGNMLPSNSQYWIIFQKADNPDSSTGGNKDMDQT